MIITYSPFLSVEQVIVHQQYLETVITCHRSLISNFEDDLTFQISAQCYCCFFNFVFDAYCNVDILIDHYIVSRIIISNHILIDIDIHVYILFSSFELLFFVQIQTYKPYKSRSFWYHSFCIHKYLNMILMGALLCITVS